MLMRKLLLNDEVDAKLIDDKEINVKCIEADKKETEVDVIDVDVKLIDDDEIDMKCIKADKKETEVDNCIRQKFVNSVCGKPISSQHLFLHYKMIENQLGSTTFLQIRQNPATLNNAINLARTEEKALNDLIREMILSQTSGSNQQGNQVFEKMNELLKENYQDDLVKKLEKLKLAKLEQEINSLKGN
ncbi:6799_t:CDS:2 [Rhizophagus irregularis]|nr:6799_t:CDS:2 [Rhizophagus irregularis]